MLGEREDRVGIGKVDDPERVRIGHVWSQRPIGNQFRRVNAVIVVPQETGVDIEVGDEVGQHLSGHRDRRSRIHRHQLGGDGGDNQI